MDYEKSIRHALPELLQYNISVSPPDVSFSPELMLSLFKYKSEYMNIYTGDIVVHIKISIYVDKICAHSYIHSENCRVDFNNIEGPSSIILLSNSKEQIEEHLAEWASEIEVFLTENKPKIIMSLKLETPNIVGE
jgi:hypothetical protein